MRPNIMDDYIKPEAPVLLDEEVAVVARFIAPCFSLCDGPIETTEPETTET